MRPEFHNTAPAGTVNYSTDAIRQTAARLLASAGAAQATHAIAWNTIQNYLDNDPYLESRFSTMSNWIPTTEGQMPNVYALLRAILEPHQKRVSDALELQADIAQALFDLADQIDQTEQAISAGFGGTPTSPSSPPARHSGPTF
jgi:hypothetical protein